MRATRALLGLILIVLYGTTSTLAQRIDGTIRGVVRDTSGAVVGGATVTVTNDATQISRTNQSESDGSFNVPNLLVGTYSVAVELTGFKKYIGRGVEVRANQTTDHIVTLELGEVQTVVEVEAGSELIQTTTSQVGGSMPSRAVVDIPNASEGGNPLNAVLVFPNTTSQGGGVLGEGGSIGGNRPRNNSFTIDGVDNNDVGLTGSQQDVIPDAVQEFNLLTNQFSAEYGHSTAGQFNIITKSGTNQYHGSAFYYGQNKKLNGLDNLEEEAIKNGDIPGKPRFDYARVGGAFGGPAIKDKLFYFGAYQYQTQGQQVTGVTVKAPTAAGLQTLTSLAANDAVRRILAQVPTAGNATETINVKGQTIPIGDFQAFAPDYFAQHDFQTNVDANLANHQLRGRFLFGQRREPNINLDLPLDQFTGDVRDDNRKFAFTDVWAISSRLINDFRISYSRNVSGFTVPDEFANFPNVSIDDLGLSIGPDSNSPQSDVQNTYQVLNNMSWTKGRHNLKYGGEYRNWIAPNNFLPRERGEYGYSEFNTLVDDLVPDGLNGALRGAGSGFFAGNQAALYWFAQDDFKVTPRLTLNLGLRYEWTSNPRDVKLQTLNSISTVPGLFEFREPKTDTNNWAPRFGFAYDPTGSGKTAIRGGFGIAYDITFQNLPLLQLPPQLQTEQNPELACNLPTRPSWCATSAGFLSGNGLPQVNVPPATQAEARTATQGIILDQVQPKTMTWSLSVQRELTKDWQVEARYLGTRAVSLFIQSRLNAISAFETNPNLVLPTYFASSQVPASVPLNAPTRADFLGVQDLRYSALGFDGGLMTAFPPIGNSIYHAGSVEVNRRFAQGLFVKGSYTWSHAIDDSTNELFSSRVNPRRPQYPYNIQNERGHSTIDRRHKFVVGWLYELPRPDVSSGFAKRVLEGWQINGTYLAESGQWITPLAGADSNGDLDSAGDRALVNPNGQGLTGSDVNFVLRDPATGATSVCTSGCPSSQTVGYLARNPSARFVVAQAGTISTAGRNTILSPGLNNWNLAVFKNTYFAEQKYIQFRVEFLNAFNHRQRSLGLGTFEQFNANALSTSYANVNSLLFLNDGQFSGGNRIIQMGLKVIF
jgi:hypothetical protein